MDTMEVYMTAKEWLSRGRTIERRVAALRESKIRAYAMATNSVSATRMGYSGRDNYITGDKKTERYAAISAEVDRQIAELEKVRGELLNVISQVKDDILCALLTEYYINNLKWDEVADRLGYTTRHVSRLHRRALDCVRAITGYE